MNYVQLVLFVFLLGSVSISGNFLYTALGGYKRHLNRINCLGESLLLGSIFLVGQLLILSFIGFYKGPFLWGAVALNYLFIFNKNARFSLKEIYLKSIAFDFPTVLFITLLLVFFFRNSFFLIDVDSLSTYLYTQKLWLSSGTSLIGDPTFDVRIFSPQFNSVFYGLGLSFFEQETLFPQLINIFWRAIVLFLVFGYTSFRFNKYYGLAAVMLVLFNEHFFYSGINQYVILNGAVIAFFFAAAYNFWEARSENGQFRFLLALIFSTQVMANKYQMAFSLFFLIVVGFFIQSKLITKIKNLIFQKKSLSFFAIAVFFMLLWYLKNFLVTGDFVFPIFAGKMQIFNWTPELEKVLSKSNGCFLPPMMFLKFMNFMFIWPGISAAKYVIIGISFLPIFLFIASIRNTMDKEATFELCFWLAISILAVLGVCFGGWADPRAYRYPLGVLVFSAILLIHYINTRVFAFRNKIFLCGIILLLSILGGRNEGIRVIMRSGEGFKFPSIKENIAVILNKIHTDYAVNKDYPEIKYILSELDKNKDKLKNAAWNTDSFNFNIPAFLLPVRPVVSLWANALIRWDSYNSENLVLNDLKKHSIEWVMSKENNKIIFVSAENFAKDALKLERYPKKTFFDYGFPEELTKVEY